MCGCRVTVDTAWGGAIQMAPTCNKCKSLALAPVRDLMGGTRSELLTMLAITGTSYAGAWIGPDGTRDD